MPSAAPLATQCGLGLPHGSFEGARTGLGNLNLLPVGMDFTPNLGKGPLGSLLGMSQPLMGRGNLDTLSVHSLLDSFLPPQQGSCGGGLELGHEIRGPGIGGGNRGLCKVPPPRSPNTSGRSA